MAARRGGLGKGLDSLIPKKIRHISFDEDSDMDSRESELDEDDLDPVSAENPDEDDEDSDDDVNPFALDDDDDDEEDETENDRLAESEEASFEENSDEASEVDQESEENEQVGTNEQAVSEAEAANTSNYTETEKSWTEDPRETEVAQEEQAKADDHRDAPADIEENPGHAKANTDEWIGYEADGENAVIMMRTSLVEPNRHQPRKKFNDATLEELAESIRRYGVIQPLLVQKREDYYEIIAGERRWRAARKAGLKEIPVIVREYSSQEAAEIALIENIQREDLNPIEEAQAYDRLIREFALTQEEVAAKVARSRSAITNSLRLLRLCEDVRDMVIRGEISEGHARAILALPSPGHQKMLADQVVSDKLSVRETEKLIRKIMKPAKEAKENAKDMEREAALGQLSSKLTNVLGTRVQILSNARGKGKIEIDFYSDEELDRIYELLQTIQ